MGPGVYMYACHLSSDQLTPPLFTLTFRRLKLEGFFIQDQEHILPFFIISMDVMCTPYCVFFRNFKPCQAGTYLLGCPCLPMSTKTRLELSTVT